MKREVTACVPGGKAGFCLGLGFPFFLIFVFNPFHRLAGTPGSLVGLNKCKINLNKDIRVTRDLKLNIFKGVRANCRSGLLEETLRGEPENKCVSMQITRTRGQGPDGDIRRG